MQVIECEDTIRNLYYDIVAWRMSLAFKIQEAISGNSWSSSEMSTRMKTTLKFRRKKNTILPKKEQVMHHAFSINSPLRMVINPAQDEYRSSETIMHGLHSSAGPGFITPNPRNSKEPYSTAALHSSQTWEHNLQDKGLIIKHL